MGPKTRQSTKDGSTPSTDLGLAPGGSPESKRGAPEIIDLTGLDSSSQDDQGARGGKGGGGDGCAGNSNSNSNSSLNGHHPSSSSSSSSSSSASVAISVTSWTTEEEEINYLEGVLKKHQSHMLNRSVKPVSTAEKASILDEHILKPLIGALRQYLIKGSFQDIKSTSSVRKNWAVQQITGMKALDYSNEDAKMAYDWAVNKVRQFITEELMVTLQPHGQKVDLIFQSSVCWTACEVLGQTLNYFWRQYVERYITTTAGVPLLQLKINTVQNTEFFEKIKAQLTIKISDEINELRQQDWERDDSTQITFIESERYHFLAKVKDLFVKIGGINGMATYSECIEGAFLKSVHDFYQPRHLSWKAVLPTSSSTKDETYMRKVYAAVSLERQRAYKCLSESSVKKLDELMLKLFISPYTNEIESYFSEIFGDLFSFDRYELANCVGFEAGYVPEKCRIFARNAFEMMDILDKSNRTIALGPPDRLTTLIGVLFASSVEENFIKLVRKFRPAISSASATASATASSAASASTGIDLLKPDKDTKERVYNFFVQFHHVYSGTEALLSSIFGSSPIVCKPTANSYTKMANLDPKELFGKTFGETMAMFYDMNMTKNKRKVSTTVGDDTLYRLLNFAVYISDKVAFMNHLQHCLFYRVTDDNFEDVDKELTFNARLVERFGLQMAVKVMRMLHSLTESTAFAQQYVENSKSSSSSSTALDFDVQPLILDGGVVVKQKKVQFGEGPIIAPFSRAFERLQSYYIEKFGDKRKLEVLYPLGNCQVKCTFYGKGKPETFTATTGVLQAIYLSAFSPSQCGGLVDGEGFLSFDQLDKLVKMTEGEYGGSGETVLRARLIHSLVRAKLLVHKLAQGVENPANPSAPPKYSKLCKVKANPEYKNPARKFTVPSFKMEFSEKVNLQEEINILIDTCVVRIMKSRRAYKIQELTAEVQQQLAPFYQFSDISVLKRRYETLIEREFIKRDDDDFAKYVYLP